MDLTTRHSDGEFRGYVRWRDAKDLARLPEAENLLHLDGSPARTTLREVPSLACTDAEVDDTLHALIPRTTFRSRRPSTKHVMDNARDAETVVGPTSVRPATTLHDIAS